jgi:RNA polymerase sporulation-specific sigma factor
MIGGCMRDSYEQNSDEELILRLRDGEENITDYIMDKYKNLVKSKAKSMYILGADSDDLIQEGMIGLFKAIRDYDSGRDASFFTFADLCISRQIYTAVQASGRQKHSPLNTYISLYSSVTSKDEPGSEEAELLSVLASKAELSPEEMVIDKENVENLEKTIERELSTFEKQVLDLYITGMSYVQIAKVLGKDEKSTDNALQRIKSKLRKAIL